MRMNRLAAPVEVVPNSNVRRLIRSTRPLAAGFAGGLAVILVVGVAAGVLMSRAQARAAIREAPRSASVAHPNTPWESSIPQLKYVEGDYYTDCALLLDLTA